MDFSPPSPFGQTLRLLTADRGAAVLMSFLAAFHAKTSAQPVEAPESKASDPACGWKWPASYAKYDPASRSWKTRQSSLLGGLAEFSETWPRWGSMLDGECSALATPALRTNESGSGLWPTIRSTDADRGGRGDLIQAVRGNPNTHYKTWPTPHGFSKDGRSNGPSGNELGRAVNKSFPTPVSTSATGGRKGLDGGAHARQRMVEEHGEEAMRELIGGSLNPTWVEWLMGWPIEWTALKPLETAKFRQWLRSHGAR